MLLKIVRAVFILLVGVVAWYVTKYLSTTPIPTGEAVFYSLCASGAAAALVGIDLAFKRQVLRSFVGVVFGIIAGILISAFLVVLLTVFLLPTMSLPEEFTGQDVQSMIRDLFYVLQAVVPMITLAACYLTVSVVLRTKDEFRFVIPYVDFAEQSRTSGGMILDSSVLIDGRIIDVAEKLCLNDPMIVPRFVVDEMQKLADAENKLVRAKGRRGLDMVGRLQASTKLRTKIFEGEVTGDNQVDSMLVRLCQMLGGRLVTNDFNLAKVAHIEKIEVVNINDLAGSLRAPYLPGEELDIKVVRRGEEKGQGVGYLDDGTMVVIESARDEVNETIRVVVTSSIQTSAGRMIFGRKASASGEREEKKK